MNPTWAFIANLKAGHKTSQKKWNRIQQQLQEAGVAFVPFYTDHVGHARELAMEALDQGYKHIAVMGGDGTISEVVDGIFKSGKPTNDITVGLLPFGTGNDWARYWGIKNTKTAIQCLSAGKTVTIDMGKVCFEDDDHTIRYFINAFGFGFDARVLELTNRLQHWFKGKSWTYTFALFLAVLKHRTQSMQFETETVTETFACYTASVGNGVYTGGGIPQTPLAQPTDQWMDVMAMGKLSFGGLLKALRLVFVGRLLEHPSVHFYRVQKLTVSSDQPMVSEVDGILQPISQQFTVEVLPQALQFVCP